MSRHFYRFTEIDRYGYKRTVTNSHHPHPHTGNSLASGHAVPDHKPMYPVKLIRGKSLLWLWLFPTAVSWLLFTFFHPAGRNTSCHEIFILSAGCLAAGFGLALKTFSTPRQRLLGGLFFSGSSLCLVFSVIFLGCLPFPEPPPSQEQILARQAQIRTQQERQTVRVQALNAGQFIPRDAAADSTMLDLSPYYDAWMPLPGRLHSGNLQFISPGTHVWDGIKFDVRGRIQLQRHGPTGVPDLPVGRRCSDIYFLHGANRGLPGDTVCRFVIHFAGTNLATVPMIFGQDVGTADCGTPALLQSGPTNLVVCMMRLYPNAPPQPIRRFYLSRWANPFPDLPVEKIDYLPGQTFNGSFLVAITVKPLANKTP